MCFVNSLSAYLSELSLGLSLCLCWKTLQSRYTYLFSISESVRMPQR